ncbi:MAG: ATP-binding protein [Mycobacteriaceae bacterium]
MVAVKLDPRDWGVRVRLSLAAVGVLAVTLAVVAAGLLWVLKMSLDTSADSSAATRAAQIAAQLHTDAPAGQDSSLVATTGETSVVQILTRSGAVLLASVDAPAEALARPLPDGVTAQTGPVDLSGETGEFRVAAQGVAGPGGELTVVVGVDVAAITETLTTVGVLLAVGLPLVVVVAGVLTYVLVGRSLLSVERMRSRVAAVSSSELGLRLVVPRPRDEISRLAQTLNAMLSRLQNGHDAQRRFVADASHELRSPLATVTAALELAQDRPGVIDRALVRTHLLPEAQRMQRLVDDLLLLAKADEQGLPLRVADVDLDDLVEDQAGRLRAATTLTVTTEMHAVRIRGDEAQLARVTRNLAENAARHAGTRVRLSCRSTAGGAELVVEDDGPGVPVEQRERVLERFVRLDSGRSRSVGGSGLGLAIVAEIVAAHGGTVTIADSDLGGARVVVTLLRQVQSSARSR